MGQKLCLKLSSKCFWICKSQKLIFCKSVVVSNICFFSSFLDICLKDTMSLADSLYNLQLIQEFCQEYLNQCCHFSLEDMLYAASSIKVKIISLNKTASNIHRIILLMICLVFISLLLCGISCDIACKTQISAEWKATFFWPLCFPSNFKVFFKKHLWKDL